MSVAFGESNDPELRGLALGVAVPHVGKLGRLLANTTTDYVGGMSEPLHFPDLNDSMLVPFRVLRLLTANHPGALEVDECPYTEEQKAFLRGLFSGAAGEDDSNRKTFLDGDGDRSDIMERQIAIAIEDMDALQRKLSTLDQKDKIAFLKAKPGLLEKLMDLSERNRGQRAVADFMKRMYAFIHDELDADQRTKLIKQLGTFVDEQ